MPEVGKDPKRIDVACGRLPGRGAEAGVPRGRRSQCQMRWQRAKRCQTGTVVEKTKVLKARIQFDGKFVVFDVEADALAATESSEGVIRRIKHVQ
jgi:hypothetical protein